MNKLIEQLLEFQDSRRNKGVGLEKLFEKLAKYLLYGGHFHCSERYDLYITSVEFYYHEEIGDNDKRVLLTLSCTIGMLRIRLLYHI